MSSWVERVREGNLHEISYEDKQALHCEKVERIALARQYDDKINSRCWKFRVSENNWKESSANILELADQLRDQLHEGVKSDAAITVNRIVKMPTSVQENLDLIHQYISNKHGSVVADELRNYIEQYSQRTIESSNKSTSRA